MLNSSPSKRAPQKRAMSAMLRRLALRRASQALATVTALLALTGQAAHAATYAYQGTATTTAPNSGFFSGTGFNPTIGSGAAPVTTTADTLSFAGTSAYTATDDLTAQILAGSLSFTNAAAVTLARGAGGSNSIGLGAVSPTITTNAGAVTIALDLGLSANAGFTVGAGGLTLSGAVSGTGFTLTKIGTGVLTIAPGGSLGATGAALGAVTTNAGNIIISGGSVTASSLTAGYTSTTGTTISLTNNGTINLTGTLGVNPSNQSLTSFISLLSGTANVNAVSIARGNTQGALPAAGSTTDGLYVNGATLNITTTLNVGTNGTNSTANMRMDSGAVTVGGTTTIQNATSGRYSVLDISGGTFTSNDTTGAGILIGTPNTVTNTATYSELLVRGGSLSANKITLGGSAQTGGINVFTARGGTVNIGAGGIVLGGATGTSTSVVLGSSAVATAPTIGALADWTSSVPMALTNSSSALPVVFQAADSLGTAHNITLTGVLSGGGKLSKTGAGTLTLTGVNTYSGGTLVSAGTLSGSTTGISANVVDNGTVDFTQGTAGTYAGTISGTGNVTKGGNPASPAGVGGAVTFSGPNTFAGSLSVNAGILNLSSSNTYTGATNINAGVLNLAASASLSDTSVTVSNLASFTAAPGTGNIAVGTTAASLNLSPGALFSLGDSNIGTLTFNTTGAGVGTVLTLGGTTALPTSLTFDLGSTGADKLIANNGTVSLGTQNNITLNGLGAAPSTLTGIPIIIVPNGTLNTASFALQTTTLTLSGVVYNVSLGLGTFGAGSNNELVLNLAAVGGTSQNYYFTGSAGSSFSAPANFATSASGTTAQSTALSSTSNVFETATSNVTGANAANQTLDGSVTINTLNFTGTGTPAATTAITIAPGTGGTLTIAPSFGTGITVQAGSASHTISANLVLSNSQTFALDNSAAAPLTISGAINEATSGTVLTKTGVGKLVLSGTDSLTGGTVISGGTIALGGSNILPSASPITVGGTGSIFDLAGNSQTISSLSDGGFASGTVTSSSGTPALTLGGNDTITFSGTLAGTLSFAQAGTGTQTLSGANTFTGSALVTSGTLTAGSNTALSTSSGLTINPSAGAATVKFTSSAPSIASLSGTSGSVVTLGGLSTPTTLTISSVGSTANTVYAGVIGDGGAASQGSLSLAGGSLTLGGANTFAGTTTVISGTTLTVGNTLALQNSTVNYLGGSLIFGPAITAATFGALSGSQGLALTNTAATPAGVALTTGGNNASTTYSGGLLGSGALIKVGTGILSLTGTSSLPSSAVAINAGTININGGSLTAASLSNGTTGSPTTTTLLTNSGSLNLSGTLAINTGNQDITGFINLTSGTAAVNAVAIGREHAVLGTLPTQGDTTDGLYVNGAVLNITTTLNVGAGNTNSSASARLDAGSITVGGTTNIQNITSARYSVLDINGGTFTSNDTAGAGILVGTTNTVTNTAAFSELLVRGGTLSTNKITLGSSAQTSGNNVFTARGGTTYLGAGGIVLGGATGTTTSVVLGSTSVATAPVIGANADWSSSVSMALSNSSSALPVTIQAADAGGTAHAIALSGVLSGSGTLAKTGGGTLTLTGTNTYSGGTAISAGTVSGPTTGYSTGNVSIASGATAVYTQNTASVYAASITGSGSVTVDANPGGLSPGNTITYTGNDSASGGTSVKSGTLLLGTGGALTGPVGAAVGGTVGLSADNQIAVSSNVTLSGGTLQANGHSEGAPGTPGLGTLTLLDSNPSGTPSALDFGDASGTNANTLAFSDSAGITWNGIVNLVNYTDGADKLYIGTTSSLSAAQLTDIRFNGVGAVQTGTGLITFSTAAPEPSGWVSMLIGAGVLGIAARKRRKAA